MDLIQSIHDKMKKERILFAYRGNITERNSLPMLTLLENEMNDDSYGIAGRKRLFMFVLENLQNIVKHGEQARFDKMPVVVYSRTDDGYNITTGNIISDSHIENLRKRLDKVNGLELTEIKNLYREILSTAEFSNKGGAGLGLIEMAIKTGNKLDYDFIHLKNGYSYFILSKTVDSKGIGMHSGENEKAFKGVSALELEEMMAENRMHMIWSGHLSEGIEEEVLSLTEARLSDEDVDARIQRRVFNIMVEILENVLKYNPGREPGEKYGMPVATVSIEDNKFLLTTGNLIHRERVTLLKEKLDVINSCDNSELKDLFYRSLSEQTIESDSTGNLGLISVARKSGSKLRYSIEDVNDRYSYFLLTVKVEDQQV
ncbi:MAG: SiaB family protein kinase [Bacteroidales bacterium]